MRFRRFSYRKPQTCFRNTLDKQAGELGWSELALNEEKIATAIHNIRGIEKDEFLSKVAKADGNYWRWKKAVFSA